PLGYGVSLTWRDAVILLGGSNSTGHFSDAFMMRYRNGEIEIENLPSLPYPVANTSGVLIGDVIYIAGGLKDPASKVTEENFWSMDLAADASKRTWKVLDTWPGPSRMFAVVGGIEGSFYLFSGTELIDGSREYLKDAYKYEEEKGWTKLAPLPESVVAAPSPAFAYGKNHLFIYGGDDGKLASKAAVLKDKHPGFSRNILAYNTDLNRWNIAGQIWADKKADAESNPNESRWAPVTTPLVVWNGNIIIPGGEIRPAVRTKRILQASPVKSPDQ
ncbi:MAG TPA: galactose oxidase, partial [Sphingobacteriaceae bacterium]